MDVGVFIDSVWGNKNFEMCVTGDGSDGDPDTWLRRWIISTAENNFGYSNPELDDLVAAGAAAATEEERKASYDESCEIVTDEQPLTYLFGGYLYSALQDNVTGLTTVSYTHLDVYKRQGENYVYGPLHGTGLCEVEAPWVETSSAFQFAPGMTFQIDSFAATDEFGVDVYKRQIRYRGRGFPCCRQK